MSLEHRDVVANADPPDIGFQAAFGFYLGLAIGGAVAFAGVLADVTTATLLGIFPTIVTATTIAGHVFAKRARGLPERIGRRRRWRLACYLPAIGFAVAAAARDAVSVGGTGRYLAVTIGLALVLGVTAFGLERLCRNRFVRAITADDPTVTWTYQPVSVLSDGAVLVVPALFLLMGGLTVLVAGDPFFGLLWIVYGVAFGWNWIDSKGKKYYGKRFSIPEPTDADPQRGELRAHEHGLRLDRGRSTTFLPWDRIADVELTDDELVLKRRFRSLRCDRAAIDDPEAVYEAIETARGSEGRR